MIETLEEQRNRAHQTKLVERKKLELAKDLVEGKISGSQYIVETAKLYSVPPIVDFAEDVDNERSIEVYNELERRFP